MSSKEGTPVDTKPVDNESKDTTSSVWTAVWDDNAQAYYWWNTESNETTWINPEGHGEEYIAPSVPVTQPSSNNPLDFLLDRIDAVNRKKLDHGEETTEEKQPLPATLDYAPNYEPEQADYTSTAHFNSRTGRFTTQADVNRLNPDNLTIESRAKRQMQFYFDVDTYTEERNAEKLKAQDGRIGKKKQLTRKEVEYFKKMKKEKKSKRAREWLLQ